ncbi:MAG: peptide-methionine (R)-S-oxide reductase MsrB [Candidatus Taylorbacteria bacterium]|nr:peptide-methionine (R)-S-oxide reductase MsrB [Candidatus Taylorbacteria bacterium]
MKKDEELDQELYKVARAGGTEAPFTGKYWKSRDKGMYKCAICGNQLFSSDTKFDSEAPGLRGWPSFDEAIPGSVDFKPDNSHEMRRTEVVCRNCGAHLGHIFEDEKDSKTGKHYCINSVCLELTKEEQLAKKTNKVTK